MLVGFLNTSHAMIETENKETPEKQPQKVAQTLAILQLRNKAVDSLHDTGVYFPCGNYYKSDEDKSLVKVTKISSDYDYCP